MSSVYDALSLIDTYMCDASVLDFPINECGKINPFQPLPDIDIESYKAKDPDYQKVCKSIEESLDEKKAAKLNQATVRQSVISKVFTPEEIFQLGNIFSEVLEESEGLDESYDFDEPSWSDEVLTAGNTPETSYVMETDGSFGPISAGLLSEGDITAVNSPQVYQSDSESDSEGYSSIPIGIDNSPILFQEYTNSATPPPVPRKSHLKTKKFPENVLSTPKLEASEKELIDQILPSLVEDKSQATVVLRKVRKLRTKIEFSDKEITMIKESWNSIFAINNHSSFSSLNPGSHKSLFSELPSKVENTCAYSFTKQFYSNLFRNMSFVKDFFPKSTKQQIVALGDILSIACNKLEDPEYVKRFLYKNNHMNSQNDDGYCSHTIFGYTKLNVEENEVYFSIFGKIFLRTINENFQGEFNKELEACWSKFYLFLFSCIVGGLRKSERTKVCKTDSTITINIDRDEAEHKAALNLMVLDEESAEDDEFEPKPPAKNDEIPFSVAAYRTSPAVENVVLASPESPSKEKKRFQLYPKKKDDKSLFLKFSDKITSKGVTFQTITSQDYVTNGKRIRKVQQTNLNNDGYYENSKRLSHEDIKLLQKLRLVKNALTSGKIFKKFSTPPHTPPQTPPKMPNAFFKPSSSPVEPLDFGDIPIAYNSHVNEQLEQELSSVNFSSPKLELPDFGKTSFSKEISSSLQLKPIFVEGSFDL